MKKIIIFLTLILIPNFCFASLKIGAVDDVHYNSFNNTDAVDQITSFVSDMEVWKPDFMIEVGDFVDVGWIGSAWETMSTIYSSTTLPYYYVYGNHEYGEYYNDGQENTRANWLASTSYASAYYTFEVGNYKIIVLDPNYNQAGDDYPLNWYSAYLPPEQIAWLETELNNTTKKIIIFSHQRIDKNSDSGAFLDNGNLFTDMIDEANVIAVFAGHDHQLYKNKCYSTPYYSLYATRNKDFPLYPYDMITIDDNDNVTIEIGGVNGTVSGITPSTPFGYELNKSTLSISGTITFNK